MLVTAPTGSGKTLAAFLCCLDRLVARGDRGRRRAPRPDAASSTSRRSRRCPTTSAATWRSRSPSCAALAAELGYPAPDVRTAVRTGDTTARERREAARRPPHVLVTTPESLFILLTSESGRRALRDVRTVIVDEIHAVAADKRGAHLALSLERLDALVAAPAARLQRIGLSATVRPLEVAARLLVGRRAPLPAIVDVGQRRDLDLAIEVPDDELGAVCTNEQWGELYDRIADAGARAPLDAGVRQHAPPGRAGDACTSASGSAPSAVAAHHGSLSRERRHHAEQRLKEGELRVVVATASLELGIDVGAVDLACLIGSPRSIATALQRIGRSGHALRRHAQGAALPAHARPAGRVRGAGARGAARPRSTPSRLRDAPLDVLAQQIVAACAVRGVGRGRALRAVPAGRALRRARARRLRRGRRHAVRGHRHQPRARGRAAAPRRASTGGCAGGAARAWRRSPRAAPSPTTPTTTSCSSPRAR